MAVSPATDGGQPEPAASPGSAASAGQDPGASSRQNAFRLREGSKLVDRIGEFRLAGDRIAFYPSDSNGSFHTLENLALERVWRVLDETRTPRVWRVTGVVTEYRGGNYLLVTHAVLKTTNLSDSVSSSLGK